MYRQTKEELKVLRERADAVEKEERRRLIDAAKKRAAAQNVDYPTFAAMVSVAHLKPIQRRRADEVKPASSRWTPRGWSLDEAFCTEEDRMSQSLADDPLTLKRWQAYEREATLKLLHTMENVAGDPIPQKHVPLTSDQFVKEWRKLTGNINDRMRFLRKMSPDDITRTFKVDLPSRILTEVLEALRCWQLNGMSCAPIDPEARKGDECQDVHNPSLKGSGTTPGNIQAAPDLTSKQLPPGSSCPPDLVKTLASIKMLSGGSSSEEVAGLHMSGESGGDPKAQTAFTHLEGQNPRGNTNLEASTRDAAEETASQMDWVTNELASIAEGPQHSTCEGKQHRFLRMMRNRKMLWLLRMLNALTRCGRFDLALKMGKNGRATAASILDLLVADMSRDKDEEGKESDEASSKRSYYECRPNFVTPVMALPTDDGAVELDLQHLNYLRAVYQH